MKHTLFIASLWLAACGGTSKPPIANSGGTAHVAGDVDGDGTADAVTFADGVVTVIGKTIAVPAEFEADGARVVDVGTEAVVVLDSVVVEDDLRWRVFQFRGGEFHDLGEIFIGNDPVMESATGERVFDTGITPGDGSIHIATGNCGQSTALVYRVVAGKIEKDEKTTGTYSAEQCSACPYVLVDSGAGLQFVGESLRNLVGVDHAAEDALVLPGVAAGQTELVVVLSEVKPETTYLDAIAVDFGDTRVPPRGCPGTTCTANDQHDVFTLGEKRRFVFAVPAGFVGTPVLYARGYYQPFAPTVER
jgi:hypothetical protein